MGCDAESYYLDRHLPTMLTRRKVAPRRWFANQVKLKYDL